MYISSPPGTIALAGHFMPPEEHRKLSEMGLNAYGEDKSLTILQFMRDLEWVYISYEEGGVISLKPTEQGLSFFERGMTGEFEEEYGTLYDLIRNYLKEYLKDPEDIIDVAIELADYYSKSGNFTRAIDVGSTLITLGNKKRNYRALAKAHDIYANANLMKLDSGFAKNHYETCILYSERSNDLKSSARGYMGLGSVSGYSQDLNSAIQYYEKAFLIFKEKNDETGMNQVKLNEALVYGAMRKFKEFFEMNEEAKRYFIRSGDKQHLEYCYVNESVILLNLGRINEAIDSVVEAYETAKEAHNKRVMSLSGLNIARIYLLTNRAGDAFEYINDAYEYFRKNLDTNGVALCYDLYCTYYVAMGDLKSADSNLERMLKNYQVKNFARGIVDGYTSYIRTMKIYDYPDSQIIQKIDEFRSLNHIQKNLKLFNEVINEIIEG